MNTENTMAETEPSSDSSTDIDMGDTASGDLPSLRERLSTGVRSLFGGMEDVTSALTPEPDEESLSGVGDSHRTLVAPSNLECTPQGIRMDDREVSCLWVGEYPDAPSDGFLETLYSAPETRETDVSIHLTPRDTRATLDSLENQIEDLEADHQQLTEKHRANSQGVKRDLEDHRDMYDALRNTSMRAFDVSTYLTVRGESGAERESGTNPDTTDVSTVARQAPANLTPIHPRWLQLPTYVSGSPVALDRLNEDIDSQTPMLGGAVGAMYPFVSGAYAEPGIEYGAYARNSSPLVLDRFKRDTGYCSMVIGQLGAGKSFATKLRLVRRAMFDGETMIVMLDPMRGFEGVNRALDGERVVVGGRCGLNPLEFRGAPEEVYRERGDIDPWSEQVNWVMSFFRTFFASVADNPLDERHQTLRRAVQEAYHTKGITRDPETHDRESPTVRDIISILEEMVEHPETFGYTTSGEREAVERDAEALLKDLRPSFREGGDLGNLARSSEYTLDSDVVYLDLHQEEGTRGRTETSLMMQVLFNSVYERAKVTDKRVIFCIDEAHYLLNDADSLEFLETAVRHSRHFDLSVEFITQTGGEFTLTPETRTIANLCSVTVLHRVNEQTEKLVEWFGLNDREAQWVASAKAGDDTEGYSEALLGIDGEGWFPIRVRASEYEARVIDGGE